MKEILHGVITNLLKLDSSLDPQYITKIKTILTTHPEIQQTDQTPQDAEEATLLTHLQVLRELVQDADTINIQLSKLDQMKTSYEAVQYRIPILEATHHDNNNALAELQAELAAGIHTITEGSEILAKLYQEMMQSNLMASFRRGADLTTLALPEQQVVTKYKEYLQRYQQLYPTLIKLNELRNARYQAKQLVLELCSEDLSIDNLRAVQETYAALHSKNEALLKFEEETLEAIKRLSQCITQETATQKQKEQQARQQEIVSTLEQITLAIQAPNTILDEQTKLHLQQLLIASSQPQKLLESYATKIDSFAKWIDPQGWTTWLQSREQYQQEQQKAEAELKYLRLLQEKRNLEKEKSNLEKEQEQINLHSEQLKLTLADNVNTNHADTAALVNNAIVLINAITKLLDRGPTNKTLTYNSPPIDFFQELLIYPSLLRESSNTNTPLLLRIETLQSIMLNIEQLQRQHQLSPIPSDLDTKRFTQLSRIPSDEETQQFAVIIEQQLALCEEYQQKALHFKTLQELQNRRHEKLNALEKIIHEGKLAITMATTERAKLSAHLENESELKEQLELLKQDVIKKIAELKALQNRYQQARTIHQANLDASETLHQQLVVEVDPNKHEDEDPTPSATDLQRQSSSSLISKVEEANKPTQQEEPPTNSNEHLAEPTSELAVLQELQPATEPVADSDQANPPSTTPSISASSNKSLLSEWHSRITSFLAKNKANSLRLWYEQVYDLTTNAPSHQLNQYEQLIKDIYFELQRKQSEEAISALHTYQRLCPNPKISMESIIDLKPNLDVTKNFFTSAKAVKKYAIPFQKLYAQYDRLKNTHPLEADLLLDAMNGLYFLHQQTKATPNFVINNSPHIIDDPRYNLLKRHRGFGIVWQAIEDCFNWIVGVIKKQPDYKYSQQHSLFKTRTQKLIEETTSFINRPISG